MDNCSPRTVLTTALLSTCFPYIINTYMIILVRLVFTKGLVRRWSHRSSSSPPRKKGCMHAGKRIWTEPLAAAQANAASVHSLSWFQGWGGMRKEGRGKAWMEWAHATHMQEGIIFWREAACYYGDLEIWLCVRTACVQKYTSLSIRVNGTIICCISSISAPPHDELFRANFFRL